MNNTPDITINCTFDKFMKGYKSVLFANGYRRVLYSKYDGSELFPILAVKGDEYYWCGKLVRGNVHIESITLEEFDTLITPEEAK